MNNTAQCSGARMFKAPQNYRAEKISLYVAWWSLFLLWLITSASTCLQPFSQPRTKKFSQLCTHFLYSKSYPNQNIKIANWGTLAVAAPVCNSGTKTIGIDIVAVFIKFRYCRMPPLTLLNTKKFWFTSFALNPYKGAQMTFWLWASWNSRGKMLIKMDKQQATDRTTKPLRRAQINERTVHGKCSHFELSVVAAALLL